MELAKEGMELAKEGMELAKEGMELAKEGMELVREDLALVREGMELAKEDMADFAKDLADVDAALSISGVASPRDVLAPTDGVLLMLSLIYNIISKLNQGFKPSRMKTFSNCADTIVL